MTRLCLVEMFVWYDSMLQLIIEVGPKVGAADNITGDERT